jgi:tetratricopeptide (TPR) repeat protein
LDRPVIRELSTLRAEASEQAAKHLVMSGRLLDSDPELAYQHALAARRCGPRVAVIREAVGVAAYTAGHWTEALAELRTARRISGDDEHWPMMADCERALGRPEKALAMAAAPEVKKLSKPSLIEMRIVAAGARADLGQFDAAVVTLQTADLNTRGAAWVPRLRFAYAAALEAAGRPEEARQWYVKAAEADPDGETDAVERLQELDGISFYSDDEDDDEVQAIEQVAAPPPPASEPESAAELIEVEYLQAEPLEVEPLEAEAIGVAPAAGAPGLAVGGPLFLDAALPAPEPDEDEAL